MRLSAVLFLPLEVKHMLVLILEVSPIFVTPKVKCVPVILDLAVIMAWS